MTCRRDIPKLRQPRLPIGPYGRLSRLRRLCFHYCFERWQRTRVGRPDLWAAQNAWGRSWSVEPMCRKSSFGRAPYESAQQRLPRDARAQGQGGSQVASNGSRQGLRAYCGRGKRRHEYMLAIALQNAAFGGALASRIWALKTAFLTVLYRAHNRTTSGSSLAHSRDWPNSTSCSPVPPAEMTANCRSDTSVRVVAARLR